MQEGCELSRFTLFTLFLSVIHLSKTSDFLAIKYQLNSSIHDLRVIDESHCQDLYYPPKPHCNVSNSNDHTKLPVFMVTWKLDSRETEVRGFCYGAINITYTCDFRMALVKVQYVSQFESVQWPWIESPSLEELRSHASSGFLDSQSSIPCPWPYQTNTTVIRKRVYPCSVLTTSSGIVLDLQFDGCDLKGNHSCRSLSGTTYFVPSEEISTLTSCPVLVDNIDLGVLEGSRGEGPRIVTLIATKTKRLFHWSGDSVKAPPVCVHRGLGLAILKDDGGYLVSMETLDERVISPELIYSTRYIGLINVSNTYTQDQLTGLYNTYVHKAQDRINKAHHRPKRGTSLSPIQTLLLEMVNSFNDSSRRNKRDVLKNIQASFSSGITDLQLSFLRAEVQHDFAELTTWLNNHIGSFFKKECLLRQGDWFRDTLTLRPIEYMVRYITKDPYLSVWKVKGQMKMCTPTLPKKNTLFSLYSPSSWRENMLMVKDRDNHTWWLQAHTGTIVTSDITPVHTSPSPQFLIPFLSGCSVDIKTSKVYCSNKDNLGIMDVRMYLHSLGPMYTPQELALLMKPQDEKTIYQIPSIIDNMPQATVDSSLVGEWMWGLVEPITKFWKLFSPNLWTWIYLILFSIVLLKGLVLVSHYLHRRRLTRMEKLLLTKTLEKPPQPFEENFHAVGYQELTPSYLSPLKQSPH